jgi:SAM-dependent methyltransferase
MSSAACPACGATGAASQATLRVETQHADYFPFQPDVRAKLNRALPRDTYDLLSCRRCGLTFASPMAAPDSTWYAIAYRALNVKPEHRWEYDAVLAEVPADARVYEIGCGTGGFLRLCRDHHLRASGVDFWPEAVESCRAIGLDASVAEVRMGQTTPPVERGSAIVSFHVLEHLEQPAELLRHAAAASQERATLWVSVPSHRRPSRLMGLREPMDEPPHHLTKWTDTALGAIGGPAGWQLANVRFEPFTLRSGLFAAASLFWIYRTMLERGWLRSSLVERTLRLLLYPVAAWRLWRHPERARMTGLSMLARFERQPGTSL